MPVKGWDYVVIGAGAAGCVVAGRLSEMLPAARIALIEAGRERLGLTTKVPGIAFIASTFARQNWNYQTEPVLQTGSALPRPHRDQCGNRPPYRAPKPK